MSNALDDTALNQLFTAARSLHTYTDQPVTRATLMKLYELASMGPTAFNSQPARYVFVTSPEAKARLIPALSSTNKEKTQKAPATAIIAYDTKFIEAQTGINEKIAAMFAQDAVLTETTAFRNSSLQGAYLIIAARALGLTAGPMSGFDADLLNREFFSDGRYRVNFVVNLGYCDGSESRPRAARFAFDAVAKVV